MRNDSVVVSTAKRVGGSTFAQIRKNGLQYKHDMHVAHVYCVKWVKIRVIYYMMGAKSRKQTDEHKKHDAIKDNTRDGKYYPLKTTNQTKAKLAKNQNNKAHHVCMIVCVRVAHTLHAYVHVYTSVLPEAAC